MNISEIKNRISFFSLWQNSSVRIILLSIVILIASVTVYSNTYKADFIWDDEYLIINNPQIKSFSHIGSLFKTYIGFGSENFNNFYRPLQELSDMIDYSIWKDDPSGFHITNIILHSAVAFTVFILFFFISKNIFISFISALFYTICPLNTESVSYIAGRADMLYTFFLLLSMLFFIKSFSVKKRSGYYIFIAIISFSLSLFSKETALILPGLLFLYLLNFKTEELKISRLLVLLGPFLFIAGIYLGLRATVLNFSGIAPASLLANIPIFYRFLTFLSVIPIYLRILILPIDLHMERTIPIVSSFISLQSIISVSIFITIILAAIKAYQKNLRIVSFGIGWFLVSLIPVSNIWPINAFIAEHWLYVPSIGLFFLFGQILDNTYKRLSKQKYHLNVIFSIGLIAAVIVYSRTTIIRNKDWKDEVSFFKSTLKYHPNNPRIYLNLGNTYFEKDQLEAAITQYRKAIELKNDYIVAYGNLGSVYLKMGLMDKAEIYLNRAIQLQDFYPIAHYNRGIIYMNRKEFKKAIIDLKIAVEQLPQLYDAYNLIARAYMYIGNRTEAINALEKSLSIMPDQKEIRLILNQLINNY